jgi:hypothetical protein
MHEGHVLKKNAPGGNFFLHGESIGPISVLTPREKKRDKAANG